MILEEIKTIEFWNYFPPEFSVNPDEHAVEAIGGIRKSIVLSKVNNKDADWNISNLSKFPKWITASKENSNAIKINIEANAD